MQSGTSADRGESARLRLVSFSFLVASLMLLLVVRLWFLQVMSGDRYAQAAEGNAIRTISVEAPRGQIFDRDGALLVDNRYAMVVSVQPAEMGDRADEIIAELAELLALSPADIHERIARSRVSAFRPKPIAADVPVEVAFYIHENTGTRFPGVYAETLPVRAYPQGTAAAHVLGYLGEIGPQELTSEAYQGYQPGDLIGWSGVERSYEHVLHGQRGLRRFQVDARGDVTGELEEFAPTPGADLKLTLDLEAQRLTEDALSAGIDRARGVYDRETGPGRGGTFRAPAGAAVVLDPSNGEVLALASHPTFEPQQFVGGVGLSYWSWLQDRQSAFPLINRAIQSSHPPGSVFKVVSAATALHEGFMTPTSQLPCPPRWEWAGTVYRNWKSSDSGALNLVQALEQSCDTVFYELARGMWTQEQREWAAAEGSGGGAPEGQAAAPVSPPSPGAAPPARERLSDQAAAWGLGRPTGIDLPGERGGVVPGRAWKREFWADFRGSYCSEAATAAPGSDVQALYADLCDNGHRWRGGDAVNMVIGQGDVQTTPLQIANAFAAMANGGTLWRPHVAREVVRPDGTVEPVRPEAVGRLPLPPPLLDYLESGLVAVTRSGTAASVFGDFPLAVAGKTGTAEIRPKQPFAWFAAYAPAEAPRYVVVVMIEEGGSGSQTAAPIVRRILEGLLGLEQTAITPGQRTD